jgi:L-lactate dehydrogenase (cytochrome)
VSGTPGYRRVPRWAELRTLLRPKPLVLDGRRRRLAAAQTVGDLRRIAERRAPRAVFDYTDGGAGDELALARATDVYRRVEFRPRVLRDVATVETATTILDVPSALPLILAPTGFTRMMHHEGEIAVARAAHDAGLTYTLSTMGTTSLEDLAAAVPGARRWFQLYLWRDRERSLDLIQRAGRAGYDTLVLTVDVPVAGARLRDVRNGMTIPPALTLRTFANGAVRPWWWWYLLTTPPLEFASFSSFAGSVAELSNLLSDPSATLRDLEWVREAWPGKLVVKGIQTVEDARMIAAAGVDGIVVSNHGGRQLDRAATPLEVLPAVAAAVGDTTEVYVDGGVRSGADMVAAVCLGATAVMIGRAYLYGLMAGGGPGVERALAILAAEARQTMQLLGAADVPALGPELAVLR